MGCSGGDCVMNPCWGTADLMPAALCGGLIKNPADACAAGDVGEGVGWGALSSPLPPLATEQVFLETAGGRASLRRVSGFGGAEYEPGVFTENILAFSFFCDL